MSGSRGILIRGGAVYDGLGNPPFTADILVKGDRITVIDQKIDHQAGAGAFPGDVRVIDARGRAVTPGFLDCHRHADAGIFMEGYGQTELAQGITTVVAGPCGIAPVPSAHPHFAEYARYLLAITGPVPDNPAFASYENYAKALENFSLPVNFGFLVGGGAVRAAVKGLSKTPFSTAELDAAQDLIKQGMEAGALGLSFGLIYLPDSFSTTDELKELAKAAKGGLLSVHIRNEGARLDEAVEEIISVGEAAGVPVNISHFKVGGKANWGWMIKKAIDIIEKRRAAGFPVTADFYPYDGSSTGLMSWVPDEMLEDSLDGLLKKLASPAGKDELRRTQRPDIAWDRIIINTCSDAHDSYVGKSVAALTKETGARDTADFLGEFLSSEGGKVGVINLGMSQADVDLVASLPWTALISDSFNGVGEKNSHPRTYGAFPKFLREYVGEKKLLSMEKAVEKMTSMPAGRFGVKDRGFIKEGAFADILIFDPAKFTDNADYTHGTLRATGMDTVIVNGEVAFMNEAIVRHSGCPVLGRS